MHCSLRRSIHSKDETREANKREGCGGGGKGKRESICMQRNEFGAMIRSVPECQRHPRKGVSSGRI